MLTIFLNNSTVWSETNKTK